MLVAMLRQFAVALIAVLALAACGIKGPLRLPPAPAPAQAETPPLKGNPEARPPLNAAEPPAAIAPADSSKK